MKNKKKCINNGILGILGGMGPLASCYLYEMITKKIKASKDQEHLDIIIFSHASIPDRTAYILDNNKENPYPFLLEDCKTLENLGVSMISIPCNTSHYFHDKLQNEIKIPINNLISQTVDYIKNKGIKHVAILATEGTIKTGLYQKELEKYNIKYSLPNQFKVTEIIYDYVKKGKEVPLSKIEDIIKDLNVESFILGCTELSVLKGILKLDYRFIDPLEIEVDNILHFYKQQVKEEIKL